MRLCGPRKRSDGQPVHLLTCALRGGSRRVRRPPLSCTPTSRALERFRTGKVRDVYVVGGTLLIVATDRISAFDYVLGSGIPDKGRILTQLSAFWFEHLRRRRPEPRDVARRRRVPGGGARARRPAARAQHAGPAHDAGADRMRCAGLPGGIGLEGIHRGPAAVCGIALPPGLRESDRLPAPIFTPATKAESGHDENISAASAAALIGADAVRVPASALTLALYARALRRTPNRAASSSRTPNSSSAGRASRARAT